MKTLFSRRAPGRLLRAAPGFAPLKFAAANLITAGAGDVAG